MDLAKTGIATRTVNALAQKKIFTEDDLARFAPRKYRDYTELRDIDDCNVGDYAAISGVMLSCEKRSNGSRQYILIKLSHGPYIVNTLSFSNVYLFSRWKAMLGCSIVVCGQIGYDERFGYSISNPDIISLLVEFRPQILTIYSSVKGVSDQNLRASIAKVLTSSSELLARPVAEYVFTRHTFFDYPATLRGLHYPTSRYEIEKARERIIFNDLLYFAYRFRPHEGPSASSFVFSKSIMVREFIDSLPFELTCDQRKAITEMQKDALFGRRLSVLLQGDVGCGKTIVAIVMMLTAAENGFQSVLIAPREALARQHYNEVTGYGEKLGFRTAFMHSGMKAAEKKAILEDIRNGSVALVVGTHAVLSDYVEFRRLALIVTDEEHLFGTEQKDILSERVKGGVHQISMSATPIPRTLAGILYGNNKQVLQIRNKPKGRLPIKTAIQRGRTNAFPFMEKEIRAGHQCYVVCPAIDENEDTDIFSIEVAEKMYREYFEPKGIKLGVLTGKMTSSEMAKTIDLFGHNEIQILISTTVIEVGINISNATVMLIENADRFGLASLHQLRGRVGRASFQSYCILISQKPENDRLKTLVETEDGFEIAEADLRIRGSGSLIDGGKQSGFDHYVDLMLQNKELYELAVDTVRKFGDTGFLNRLALVYNEHQRIANCKGE